MLKLVNADLEDLTEKNQRELKDDCKLFINSANSTNERDIDKMSKQTPSFDHSDISIKNDSIIEPESEHPQIISTGSYSTFSFGSDPHKNSLYK